MGRNFDRRVEVVFPVEDPGLRARITDEILPAFLSDNVKAHLLRPDGRYEKASRPGKAKTHQAQLHFRQLAREQLSRVREAISDRGFRISDLGNVACRLHSNSTSASRSP